MSKDARGVEKGEYVGVSPNVQKSEYSNKNFTSSV